MTRLAPHLILAALAAAAPGWSFAQALAQATAEATVKPDAKFHYALGLGASYASGNTDASSANLVVQAVRATAGDKLKLGGNALYGRADGNTTAQNISLGANYSKDLTPLYFGFGQTDYLRDKPADLASRVSLFGGSGVHLLRGDRNTFDVSAGAGYTQDRYVKATRAHGAVRDRYGRFEGLFAEESRHQLTDTTTLNQKLTLYPALRAGGGFRGVFDAGLAVAMTPVLSLTVGLNYRYNSDPGEGQKPSDLLLLTGLNVKID